MILSNKIDIKTFLNIEYVLGLLVLSCIYVYGVITFTGRYMDDAYITFRFARHTSEGFLFVWNLHQSPIEGFSNLLWTLIATLFHFFNFSSIENITYYFSAIIIIIPIIHLYIFSVKRLNIQPYFIVTLISIVLFDDFFWHSIFNGLETFLQFTLLYFTAYFFLFKENSRINVLIFSIFLVLLILNRFEGFLYAMGFSLFYLIANRNNKKINKWLPFFITLFFIGILAIFRFYFFDSLVPLSVEAKSGGKITDLNSVIVLLSNQKGWTYIQNYIYSTSIVYTIPFLVSILFIGDHRLKLKIFFIYLIILGSILVSVQNGGDWMPGYRLVSPWSFTLLLISLVFISKCKLVRLDYRISTIFLLFIMFLSVYFNVFSTGNMNNIRFDRTYFEAHSKHVGEIFSKLLTSSEYYIAARAGSLPYAANQMNVLDYHGLVYPCVGKSKKRGGTLGKREWKCMFRNDFKIFDTNNKGFALGVYSRFDKAGIPLRVIIKNKDGIISNHWLTVFVREDFLPILLKRDSSIQHINYEKWKDLKKHKLK